MTPLTGAAVKVFAVAAGVAFLFGTTGAAQAQDPTQGEALKMRIETVDGGFECAPGDASWCAIDGDGRVTLTVPQGRLVELTFGWAHVGYVQEEHIIVLDGYNLETEELNFRNREETLRFIAEQPGKFEFKCDIECDVHDYLHGYLRVSRGSMDGVAAFTPSTLEIVPSTLVTTGDPVVIQLALRGADGKPVAKSEIEVLLDAEFGGTRGKMLLATVRTDSNGVAFFEYQPRLGAEQHRITARFEGGGIYAETEARVVIEQVGVPPEAYQIAPIGLEGLRSLALKGFAGAAAAIWLVLFVVLFRAVSVRWVRKESPDVPRAAKGLRFWRRP